VGGFRPLIIFHLGLLFSVLFAQQTYEVTGSVSVAATGKPLQNVNIVLVGTGRGAATDRQGRFTIAAIPAGSYQLVASAVGFLEVKQTIRVPLSAPLIIQMEESYLQMEAVVVTGTRSERLYSEAPVATEVISRQDIMDSGARDIGELLDQRAGVSVTSSVEGGAVVNLLGIDSKYILVLLDGQPITGKFNNRIDLDQISTAVVDKVEIIKGPSSSLYGSEAMGGVINIITHHKLARSPFTLDVRYTGDHDRFNPLAQREGKRNVRLNVFLPLKSTVIQLDGELLRANVDKAIQYIDVDQYQKLSLRGAVDWSIRPEHRLQVSASQFEKYELGRTPLMHTRTDVNRRSLDLSYQGKLFTNWDLRVLIRSEDYQRDYLQSRPWGPEVKAESTRETEREMEITGTYQAFENSLNFGAELQQDRFYSARVSGGQHVLDSQGLFFQHERQWSPHFTSILGLRVDDNEEIRPVFSPRTAFMYSFAERWKLRAMLGTGFRMPSFLDRYIEWNHQQFGYQIIGNPRLKPETSRGITLSLEYYHPGVYQVSLSAYYQQFKDMIVDSLLAPGHFTYVNVERVYYSGIELQGRWNMNPSWLLSWGYNYALNKDGKTGDLVPNHPIHSANLRLRYKHPQGRLRGALKVKFVGPYPVDEFIITSQVIARKQRSAYSVLDFDGSYRLNHMFTLSFGAKNLLDTTDDHFGPFIGRTVYIELNAEINRKG